jgi:hypothetical protein
LIDFIDKTSEQNGTPINRENLMGVQGYVAETVVFGNNSITKTNSKSEKETITFSDNKIIKNFVGEKTITQTITFTNNGYKKELS